MRQKQQAITRIPSRMKMDATIFSLVLYSLTDPLGFRMPGVPTPSHAIILHHVGPFLARGPIEVSVRVEKLSTVMLPRGCQRVIAEKQWRQQVFRHLQSVDFV